MTLQQLKYVIKVSECDSLTEAAEKLYISQPSLTNAIKDLEKELNVQIFTRTNRGVNISKEGEVFLGYARQVTEQVHLLEEKYVSSKGGKQSFCVSTQHYSFSINAFVDLIKKYGNEEYDFSIRETQTYEIIDDVAKMKSEIGVLFLNDFNEKVLQNILKMNNLEFHELFKALPHVFVSTTHPLANRKEVAIEELYDYPYLSFEQGEHNSFFFSEEILSTEVHQKNIRVRDRATMLNLITGLDGYTFCSGIIDSKLNGINIITIPLKAQGFMRIGYITHKNFITSKLGQYYIDSLIEISKAYK